MNFIRSFQTLFETVDSDFPTHKIDVPFLDYFV